MATHPHCPRDLEFFCPGKELQTWTAHGPHLRRHSLVVRRLLRHRVCQRNRSSCSHTFCWFRFQDGCEALTPRWDQLGTEIWYDTRRASWQLLKTNGQFCCAILYGCIVFVHCNAIYQNRNKSLQQSETSRARSG